MKALDRALNYLNTKPRSRAQVELYLRDRGFGDEEIDEAIEQLQEYRYIDDLSFARMHLELGFEKGRGMLRIRRELAEKGVDHDTVERAIAEMEDIPDEYEMALEIAENAAYSLLAGRELSELDYGEKQKLRRKIAGRLATRGYTGETAYSAAKKVIK